MAYTGNPAQVLLGRILSPGLPDGSQPYRPQPTAERDPTSEAGQAALARAAEKRERRLAKRRDILARDRLRAARWAEGS